MLDLKQGEKIILIKRRHWIILLFHILPIVLTLAAAIIFMLFLPFLSFGVLSEWLTQITPLAQFNIKMVALFLLSLFLLFLWQMLFVQVAHYYLDTWIITNERTIHTELIGLFNRFVSSVYHYRIQDVSVDVKGILPTFLGYGNLQIQTAGSFREFIFKEIPDPYKTKEIINRAQLDFFKEMQEKEASLDKTKQMPENPADNS